MDKLKIRRKCLYSRDLRRVGIHIDGRRGTRRIHYGMVRETFTMLKIKGNKEFVTWWDYWMARIHPNQVSGTPAKSSENQGHRTKRSDRNKDEREPKARGAHFSSAREDTRPL